MERPGHEGESRKRSKAGLEPPLEIPGGQGVHREVESEGHEEKRRAVTGGGYLDHEPVGQRRGKVEPAYHRRNRDAKASELAPFPCRRASA
jgi:hypothetical protein